jgi:hypothetical protein
LALFGARLQQRSHPTCRSISAEFDENLFLPAGFFFIKNNKFSAISLGDQRGVAKSSQGENRVSH